MRTLMSLYSGPVLVVVSGSQTHADFSGEWVEQGAFKPSEVAEKIRVALGLMTLASCQQTILANQISAFNSNVSSFNTNFAGANANWASTNTQEQRANDLLLQIMKPGNALLWAAASAAGAATGAIYEAITSEREEARILERLRKARETWEKISRAATDLERAIDSLLCLRELSASNGLTREQFITQMNVELAAASSRQRLANENLDSATRANDVACVRQYSQQVANFRQLIEAQEEVRNRLQANASDQDICRSMRSDLNRLLQAEGSLQRVCARVLHPRLRPSMAAAEGPRR